MIKKKMVVTEFTGENSIEVLSVAQLPRGHLLIYVVFSSQSSAVIMNIAVL